MALVKWWMRHYGSATAKRHYAYGNSKAIRKLDKGKLQMSSLLAKDTKVKTCTKYRDRAGNLRYKGTSHLKKTEFLDLSYIYANKNPMIKLCHFGLCGLIPSSRECII